MPNHYSPAASDLISLTADLAAMASSSDAILGDELAVRQAHSYIWADDADRSDEAGMTPGSSGIQIDDGTEWRFLGDEWKLVGGKTPTFAVNRGASQFFPSTDWTIIDSAWGAPSPNRGFGPWEGGALTIKHSGVYVVTGKISFLDASTQTFFQVTRNSAVADTGTVVWAFTYGGQTADGGYNAIQLAAGDVLRAWGYRNVGSAIHPHSFTSGFVVNYIGPAV